MHWKDTQHCYTLGLETKRVWDYVGERFVERLNQSKSDGKLVELNSHCRSVGEDDCGTCECSDDSGISGALFSGKVHAVITGFFSFFSHLFFLVVVDHSLTFT